MSTQLTADYWQARYENQDTPWDLNSAAPPFASWVKANANTTGTMAVLGCGRGHDASVFAQSGWQVTGFDYSETAIQQAKERYGSMAQFVQADIFAMPELFNGQFDAVLEHTCLCAIDPRRRDEYLNTVWSLLKPGGMVLGLFYTVPFEDTISEDDGPPFYIPEPKLVELFNSKGFTLESSRMPSDSHERWQGREILAIFRKPAG
jgi:SAM-dependent methyltransferase